MKFIKILISALFLSIPTLVQAEYIVFKKDAPYTISDPQEYRKIYDVLMQYQWPMVIGNAKNMSPDELQEITAPREGAEEGFLRKKIQTISPNYDIAFMPTLIYELFVIDMKNKAAPELEKMNEMMANNEQYSIAQDDVERLVKNPSTTMQEWYDLFTVVNNEDFVFNAHQVVNNAIVNAITTKNSTANFKALHEDYLALGKASVNSLNLGAQTIAAYLANSINLEAFINLEENGHKQNSGILYRGGREAKIYPIGRAGKGVQTQEPLEIYFLAETGKPAPTFQELKELQQKKEKSIQFTPWSVDRPTGSISYGNSLMAGYLFDPGACAAAFITTGFVDKPRIGYALLVDKREFLLGNLKSLINQSLFNTLVGLFAKGEYFHTRTVSYIEQVIPFTSFAGLATILPFDKAGILLRLGNPIQKAYEFSSYLTPEHAPILKLATGSFFPSFDQTQKYYDAQNDITQLLKTMNTIQKSLVKRSAAQHVLKERIKTSIGTALSENTPTAVQNLQKYLHSDPKILKLSEQELIESVVNNNSKITKILLDAKVNPNTERDGKTILMGAIENKNNDIVDLLINAEADLDKQDPEDGITALMAALELENYNLVEKLLEAGADPDIRDKHGHTAITYINKDSPDAKRFIKLIDEYSIRGIPAPFVYVHNVINESGRDLILKYKPVKAKTIYSDIEIPAGSTIGFTGPSDADPEIKDVGMPFYLDEGSSENSYGGYITFNDKATNEELLFVEIFKTYYTLNPEGNRKIVANVNLVKFWQFPGHENAIRDAFYNWTGEENIPPQDDMVLELNFTLKGAELRQSSVDIKTKALPKAKMIGLEK